MRRGWDTQTVHAVEIRLETWCASYTSGKGGNKGDERGGPLDEAGVRAVVSPKEEGNERKRGGPVRGTRRESQEPTRCWEKEKRTVHKDGEHCTMPRPRENGVLQILTQAAFAGHAAK